MTFQKNKMAAARHVATLSFSTVSTADKTFSVRVYLLDTIFWEKVGKTKWRPRYFDLKFCIFRPESGVPDFQDALAQRQPSCSIEQIVWSIFRDGDHFSKKQNGWNVSGHCGKSSKKPNFRTSFSGRWQHLTGSICTGRLCVSTSSVAKLGKFSRFRGDSSDFPRKHRKWK